MDENSEGGGISPFISPPTNFEYCECNPITSYGYPPAMRAPEYRFNYYEYFNFDDHYGRNSVAACDVREIILNPREDSPIIDQLHRGLYMEKEGLKSVVAHLPNVHDLTFNTSDVFNVFLRWWMESLEWRDTTIVPEFARWILDPKVVVPTRGLVHLMRNKESTVIMGAWTNTVHPLTIMAPLTELEFQKSTTSRDVGDWKVRKAYFHILKMCGGRMDDMPNIPIHTSYFVWNTRGVTRKSFINNFKILMQIHRPNFVILLETRISEDSWWYVYRDLGTDMRWIVIEGPGISNGLIIMWNDNVVDLEMVEVSRMDNGLTKFKMKSNPHLSSRRRLFTD